MTFNFDNSYLTGEFVCSILDLGLNAWNATQCLGYEYDEDSEEFEEALYAECKTAIGFIRQAVELHQELNIEGYTKKNYVRETALDCEHMYNLDPRSYGVRGYLDARYLTYAIEEYNARCVEHGDLFFECPWTDGELEYMDSWQFHNNESVSLEDIIFDEDARKAFDERAAQAKHKFEEERGRYIPYHLAMLDGTLEDVDSVDEVEDSSEIYFTGRVNIQKSDEPDAQICERWQSIDFKSKRDMDGMTIGERRTCKDGKVRFAVSGNGKSHVFVITKVDIKKFTEFGGKPQYFGSIEADEEMVVDVE